MAFMFAFTSTRLHHRSNKQLALVGLAILAIVNCGRFAHAQPSRAPIVTGPQALPILAALPTRDDVSFYTVRDVPHGTVRG